MKKEDSKKIKELKHQARRKSIKEGIFASAKSSVGDYYISPFAIAINASNSVVALLSSIIGLLGPISQIFGSRLIEKYPRKKIVLKGIFFEALMWIPFIIIAILFYKGIVINLLPLLLLISFAIYVILAHIIYPAWFSWMGDIVDRPYRGRWFSKRNLITGFISIIFAISASVFLDYFKKKGWIMFGFMILFSLAVIFRLICWQIYKTKYEPKIELKKSDYFSFWDFLFNAKKSNFGKFAIYRFFLNLACSISSPLIAVYLLRNLEFSYVIYMTITFAGTLGSLTVMELWGKIADRYGNYRVLALTSIIVPIIPLLWILSPSKIYLIFIPSLIGGVTWAGFNLSVGNFVYDNVSKPKRGLAVSYMNMMGGIGTFLGAGIGAILIKFLTINIIEPIVAIFLIGTLARMIVVFIGIPKIKEVKHKREFKGTQALKNIVLKEGRSTLNEEVHQVMSIKDYLFEK